MSTFRPNWIDQADRIGLGEAAGAGIEIPLAHADKAGFPVKLLAEESAVMAMGVPK